MTLGRLGWSVYDDPRTKKWGNIVTLDTEPLVVREVLFRNHMAGLEEGIMYQRRVDL